MLPTLVDTHVSSLIPHIPTSSMGKNSRHYQGLHPRMLSGPRLYGPMWSVGRTTVCVALSPDHDVIMPTGYFNNWMKQHHSDLSGQDLFQLVPTALVARPFALNNPG